MVIKVNKQRNANYALHGDLIKARSMANQKDGSLAQIAALLDAAEYLPQLIDSETDETEKFRGQSRTLLIAISADTCSTDLTSRFPKDGK